MEMNFDRVTVPSTEIYRRRTSYTGRIPMSRTAPSRTIGAAALRSSAGRSVVSPTTTRTNVIPASTLIRPSAAYAGGGIATQSVYGGVSEGLGVGALPTALGPATLTNFGSSVSKASVGIMNTLGSFVPLAIKVVLAVIVIKIVLWLVRGRRR